MRSTVRRVPAMAVVAAVSTVGCAATDTARDPVPAVTTAPAPATTSPTTSPTASPTTSAAAPATTAPAIAVASATTAPNTTAPSVTASTPEIEVRLPRLTPPVDRIAIMGDSVFADRMQPGVVPLLREALEPTAPFAATTVENLAHPGQATVFAIEELVDDAPEVATLPSAVEHHFGEGGRWSGPLPDLVVVAVSGVDATVAYAETTPFEELSPLVVDTLAQVVARFDELGIAVVLLPSLGISDPIYDRFRGFMESLAADAAGDDTSDGASLTRPRGANARIGHLNGALAAAGLPMLFDRYTRIDTDGDGTPDPRFFTDYTTDPWPPDDGVHPNPDGQAEIAAEIADGLETLIDVGG